MTSMRWKVVAVGKRAITFCSQYGAILTLIENENKEVCFHYFSEGSNSATGRVFLLPEQIPLIRGVKTSRTHREGFRIIRIEIEVVSKEDSEDSMKLIVQSQLKKRKG